MNTSFLTTRLGLCLLALAGSLAGALAQQEAETPVSSSQRIIEEKTTVETRRVYQAEAVQRAPRKTAIFIDNRAGPQYNDKVLFFEDQVASRAGGKHFSIISREDVLKAIKTYRGSDVSVSGRRTELTGQGSLSAQADLKATDDRKGTAVGSAGAFPAHAVAGGRADAEARAERSVNAQGKLSGQVNLEANRSQERSDVTSAAERNTLGTQLDQTLSDSSSALRMAQNMGADFILFVTIGSYAKESKSFNDPSLGVSAKTVVHNLRGTYKVLEGVTGGTLGGDVFRESKTIRQSETLQVDDEDTLNGLLENAAAKVADGLVAKAAQFVPPAQPAKVEISIACAVKDLEGNEISLPDIRITENNTIVKEDKLLAAQASATIEIDGFAMGTTPARIKVSPGAHKLRLSRAGFETLELTLNAAEGLSLTPTMQMSREGFGRWKEIRDFLNHLDTRRKLTDAAAEDIRGHAQMLRQSGIRVDFRMNTTNAPTFIKKNSIFGQDNY